MNDALGFPFTASAWWVLLTLAASYVIFDILLGRVFKLRKRGWKKVDYVWLTFGALGLVGAIGGVRRQVAPSLAEMRGDLVKGAYQDIQAQARFLASGAVCRVFNRGLLPDSVLLRTQREYDSACEFAKALVKALPDTVPSDPDWQVTVPRPPLTDAILLGALADFDRRIAAFDSARQRLVMTVTAQKQSDLEFAMSIFSPFLLAVALGLRLAKVTGELRLEA